MRLVVTGREGQVVRSLVERAAGKGVDVVPLGRPDLDLAGGESLIESAIASARPDVIVSAAAYTQVDKAENDRDLAFAVNEHGPKVIGRIAQRLSVPVIHLSTDYVFDGTKASAYLEDDRPSPTGVYGESKLAGERAILAEHDDCVVLRTAWVYSPFGANFVKTMLRLASDRDEVRVVTDQRGNPTSALDVADAILAVAANVRSGKDFVKRGIFHMAGAGEASWADLAEEVFAISARLRGPHAAVQHIPTAQYPTVARRPANSRLDCGKLERTHGVRLPEWRASVHEVVTRLVQSGV